jgi:pimeloyl-ACP methyl ester carboxylesterase
LPTEDDSAGWWDYADTVVEAVGDRRDLVVVGHSMGGFTAPLVCARRPAEVLVFVAGMVPAPGESFNDWWTNTGYEGSGYEDVFYHDVPPELAAEAQRKERRQADKLLGEPWPLERLPTCRRDISSVATTACSPLTGLAVTLVSGSASRRTRWTAATTSR